VAAGLAESNGILLPGMTKSHLWADCLSLGAATGQTVGNEYQITLLIYLPFSDHPWSVG